MTRRIALFGGLNVGGKNRVTMKDLTRVLEGLGCGNVRTYIQSGNVVFDEPAGREVSAASIRRRSSPAWGWTRRCTP